MKFLMYLPAITLLAACSTTEPKPEPIESANGGGGTTGVINDVTPPTPEIRDPQPEVPRITQMQTIGILRELRKNGCVVKKFADTDGIHYSQLVVTCGTLQQPPEVE